MTMTLAWLTEEEALKHPTLAAIWQKPGISRVELAERGLVTLKPAPDGRDKLQTLVVSGKILPKDGGYYPYLPEYLPSANKKAPPLKVWRDPSVIGDEPTPAQAVTKAIYSAVRSVAVNPEPVTPAEPEVVEVEAVQVPDPAPKRRKHSNARRDKATAHNYQLIRKVAAQLEAKGEPFTVNTVLAQAGITTSYLHKPIHRELRAEVEAAVNRVAEANLGQPTNLLSVPVRTELARRKVAEAIAALEAKGQPFSRVQVTKLAGVGCGYFAQNPDARVLVDQAIARTFLKATSETVSELPEPIKQEFKTMAEATPEVQERLKLIEAELTQERQELATELERVNQEIRQLEATEKSLIGRAQRCDRLLQILQGGAA